MVDMPQTCIYLVGENELPVNCLWRHFWLEAFAGTLESLCVD